MRYNGTGFRRSSGRGEKEDASVCDSEVVHYYYHGGGWDVRAGRDSIKPFECNWLASAK